MYFPRIFALWLVLNLLSLNVSAAPDETPREISGQAIIEVDENSDFVANFIYQDDNGDSMDLSLEGEDAALFTISAIGALTFSDVPDYESPEDDNKNNTYVLRVNARDVAGDPFAIDLTVEVQAVNEAPELTNALTHQLIEDHAFQLSLSATDPERHSFEMTLAGDDSGFFSLSDEDELSMTITPSYESPFDRDRDNNYVVQLVITDEFDASQTFELSVTVQDRAEQGRFSGFADVELAELATKDGNRAFLFPEVKWTEPDNEFEGQTLTITGLLPEDSLYVQDNPTFDLAIDTVTGEVRYREEVIAHIDLSAMGQNGDDLRIDFNELTNEVSANVILNNLVYANGSDVPTEQRQLKAVLLDAEGKLTAMQTQLLFTRNDANDIDLSNHAYGVPAFVDIDGDSDLDLFVGLETGKVLLYLNESGSAVLQFNTNEVTSDYLSNVDVGNNAAPSFFDIDADGDLDAFIGNESGFISYLENTTSGAAVSFSTRLAASNPLNGVDVGANARVSFVDLDDDGDGDAFVGNDSGELVFYRNEGTAQAATFVRQDASPIDSALMGAHLALSFADVDSDGDQDALIGNAQGALTFVKNVGTSRNASFVAGETITDPFREWTFSARSTPILFDTDGDFDVDVFVYDETNRLQLLTNDSGFTLTVRWRDNDAPVIDTEPQVDVVEQLDVTLHADVTDADGDVVTYSWTQTAGEPVTLVHTTGPELTFLSPPVEQETHLTFRVTVTDGRDASSQDVLVRVFPIGTHVAGYHLPEITMVRALTVNEGERVALTALASDRDAQTLTPKWEQLSGPAVELNGADSLTPSFTAPQVEGDSFVVLQLSVSDGIFNVQQIVSITVKDAEDKRTEADEDEEDDSVDLFGLSLSWHYMLFCFVLCWQKRVRRCPKMRRSKIAL